MFDFNYWKSKENVIGAGLMSGTSCDGIDIAICEFNTNKKLPRILFFNMFEYPSDIKEILLRIVNEKIASLEELTRLNWKLGFLFADFLNESFVTSGIIPDFIASHGHTVFHAPSANPTFPNLANGTMQIGEADVIAKKTGVLTIADFRAADMANGGQGAPLIPFFDFHYFSDEKTNRILLNIGGIANFTWLPAGCKPDDVIAFDSGPGNMLIDIFSKKLFNRSYDKNGELAASGTISQSLLAIIKRHPYFEKPFPKSTGREEFGDEFAEKIRKKSAELELDDYSIIATVTQLTAETIADSIKRVTVQSEPFDVVVAGGGAYNHALMNMLKNQLKPNPVYSMEKLGIPADAKEAVGFAALGLASLQGDPANLRSVTGTSKASILGKVSFP